MHAIIFSLLNFRYFQIYFAIDLVSPGIKSFVERVEEIKQLKWRAAPSDDLEPDNDQHYYHLRDYDSEAPVNLSEADSGRVKHF